jgi:phage-related protein
VASDVVPIVTGLPASVLSDVASAATSDIAGVVPPVLSLVSALPESIISVADSVVAAATSDLSPIISVVTALPATVTDVVGGVNSAVGSILSVAASDAGAGAF